MPKDFASESLRYFVFHLHKNKKYENKKSKD